MTKLNKNLLTAAVVGVLALPGLASAATLAYPAAGKQITYAKDLIVNDGTTVYTANQLRLTADTTDLTNIGTITAGSVVRVKVTLTNGAKFDTTAPASVLVAGFQQGQQTGGAPGPLTVVGTPYYSTSGQELNFEYTATAAGAAGPAGAYFLELNSLQITSLVQGLFNGNSVGAEITVQNAVGQQVLASKAEIAKSVWGVSVTSVTPAPNPNHTIDVAGGGSGTGAFNRKTRFSPTGAVGGAAVAAPNNVLFNAGGAIVDITKAVPTNGGAATYVNNYSAIAANPQYNVVATANINVTVTGSDLTAFTGNNIWLDSNVACTKAAGQFVNGTVAAGVATFTSVANHAIWAPVTSASPGPATAYVCLQANGTKEMVAQDLKGEVAIKYNLTTQRVDPPAAPFSLSPLRLNGSTIIFQNVNPAANPEAQSFLRLTNNNNDVCPVTIDAKDDAGKHSGEVKLTLAAHTSKQINSDVLEGAAASAGVTGSFGDGAGKWYVRVTAECSNFKASALNRHADGVVTDLTPEKGIGNEWLTPSVKL